MGVSPVGICLPRLSQNIFEVMTCSQLAYRIAFASLRGITPEMAMEILARTGGEEGFFACTDSALAGVLGIGARRFSADVRAKALEEAVREEEFLMRGGVKATYFTDPDYPQRLGQCEDAPLMLYSLGDCDLNGGYFLSIVGTRHATPYGIGFVDELVRTLATQCAVPPVIVSGLAYGIDVAAHKAALREGLPTIGVLAHGLNTIYPAPHRDIAARMVRSGGMLLSDYRSVDTIHRGNFLARNRIVAGMCDALFVAESDIKGGALVTAKVAGAYNRDVFALPGRAGDRYSRGCNRLIATCGAQLLAEPEDLIQCMGWPVREADGVQQELFPELDADSQAVVDHLTAHGDSTLGDISVAIGMPVPRLMGLLVDMEFRSLIHVLPGGRYRL